MKKEIEKVKLEKINIDPLKEIYEFIDTKKWGIDNHDYDYQYLTNIEREDISYKLKETMDSIVYTIEVLEQENIKIDQYNDQLIKAG